ncbi:MAG: hypothetical protein K2M19_03880, partial [Muribaculaceae bacterium]|nr:hypothetical protein [Muribaculaceae bacterium]
RLFMAHLHYLDAPEVHDQRTLRALDHFLTASRPFLTEADHTRHRSELDMYLISNNHLTIREII